MIKFRDFAIKVKIKGGVLSVRTFEPVDESLLRVNNWIEENEIMVLNVETVVIPHSSSTRGAYKVSYGDSPWWNQFFRVWYQA